MVVSWNIGNYCNMNKNNWEKFWGFLQLSYKPGQACSSDTKLNLEPDSRKLYSDHMVAVCINNTIFQNKCYVSNLSAMQQIQLGAREMSPEGRSEHFS